MRRLPRKRYKQLVKQIYKGSMANHELGQMIGRLTGRPDYLEMMEEHLGGGETTFDPAYLPNTLDELLEGLND